MKKTRFLSVLICFCMIAGFILVPSVKADALSINELPDLSGYNLTAPAGDDMKLYRATATEAGTLTITGDGYFTLSSRDNDAKYYTSGDKGGTLSIKLDAGERVQVTIQYNETETTLTATFTPAAPVEPEPEQPEQPEQPEDVIDTSVLEGTYEAGWPNLGMPDLYVLTFVGGTLTIEDNNKTHNEGTYNYTVDADGIVTVTNTDGSASGITITADRGGNYTFQGNNMRNPVNMVKIANAPGHVEPEQPEEPEQPAIQTTPLKLGNTSISPNTSKVYAYTATEAGELTISLSGVIMGSATVEAYNTANEAEKFAIEANGSQILVLAAGETVYISVECSGYTTLMTSFEAKAEEPEEPEQPAIQTTPLNLGNTSISPDTSVVYAYTANEAGKLTISLSGVIMGSATVEAYNIANEAEKFTIEANGSQILELAAGETVYISVECSGYTTLMTAFESESEEPEQPIEPDEPEQPEQAGGPIESLPATLTGSLVAEQTHEYTWTATASGYLQIPRNPMAQYSVYVMIGGVNVWPGENGYEIAANDEVVIQVMAYSAAEYEIEVSFVESDLGGEEENSNPVGTYVNGESSIVLNADGSGSYTNASGETYMIESIFVFAGEVYFTWAGDEWPEDMGYAEYDAAANELLAHYQDDTTAVFTASEGEPEQPEEPEVPAGPAGTPDDPYIITDPNEDLVISGKDDVYYKWEATEDGVLTIQKPTGWFVSLNVSYKEIKDETGTTVAYGVDVKAGDVIHINPWTMTSSTEVSVEMTFTLAADIEYPLGSEQNPEEITELGDKHFEIASDETRYYKWVATEDGQYTITLTGFSFGARYMFTANLNGEYMVKGTAIVVNVKAGDEVILQLAVPGYNDAGSMDINAAFTAGSGEEVPGLDEATQAQLFSGKYETSFLGMLMAEVTFDYANGTFTMVDKSGRNLSGTYNFEYTNGKLIVTKDGVEYTNVLLLEGETLYAFNTNFTLVKVEGGEPIDPPAPPVVEEPDQDLVELLNGKYNVNFLMNGLYELTFTPDSEGAATGTLEIKDNNGNAITGTYTYAVVGGIVEIKNANGELTNINIGLGLDGQSLTFQGGNLGIAQPLVPVEDEDPIDPPTPPAEIEGIDGGDMNEPVDLESLEDLTIAVTDNNGEFFTWTATEDGNLIFTSTADTLNGAFEVIISTSASYKQYWLVVDGTIDADGNYTITVPVKAGDMLTIQVNADPDENWNVPDGSVTINAEYEADEPIVPGPGDGGEDVPPTGDNALMFFILAVVSMAGLVVLVSKKKVF